MELVVSKFLESDCTANHIQLLKQVKTLAEQLEPELAEKCVDKLCRDFFAVPSKDSSKRIIISVLKEFQSKHTGVTYSSFLNVFDNQVFVNGNENNEEVRNQFIESIAILIDNFDTVIQFLLNSIEIFWKSYLESVTVISSQASIYKCQTTVKVVVSILQKWEIYRETFLDPEFNLLKSMLRSITGILANDTVILNCRGNCGMAFCLLVMIIFDIDDLVNVMKMLVFYDGFVTTSAAVEKFVDVSKLPLMSNLAMISGTLLTIGRTEFQRKDCNLLTDVLLKGILSIEEKSNEAPDLLLVSRTLVLWTQKAILVLDEGESKSLKDYFGNETEIITQLMDYVWNHCEHYIDGVRHQCKDIFKNILQLHIKSRKEDSAVSNYILEILDSVMSMPWTRSGKYILLICLVHSIGSSEILQICPGIPFDVLHGIQEHAITSHGSDLYLALLKSNLSLPCDNSTQLLWLQTWVMPLLDVLNNCNSFQKVAVTQYILPAMIKKNPATLDFIVKLYKSPREKVKIDITSLLTCIRVARSQGVIKVAGDFDDSQWNNLIPIDVLKQGLCHSLDHVRLDVFSLLCESLKTSECIKEQELHLMRLFIQDNLTSQSPAFRQNMISAFKKLFTRMHESSFQINKRKKQADKILNSRAKSQSRPDVLGYYQDFVDWLSCYLVKNLFYLANFPRRGTALQILAVMKNTFSQESSLIRLDELCKPENAQVLLLSLMDTYDNNRVIILDLLKGFSSSQSSLQNEKTVAELFDSAMSLLSSPRPQDSGTATYLFKLMLTYEVTKNVLKMYMKKNDINFNDSNNDLELTMLQILMWKLNRETVTAKANFIQAAATGPLYGVLYCIRNILLEVQFHDSMPNKVLWKSYIKDLIESAVDVSTIVCPIVSSSSPEGHLPKDFDAVKGDVLQHATRLMKEALDDKESEVVMAPNKMGKSTAVTAQMILLCSWRAHKEVSLLFGEIAKSLPVTSLTDQQVDILTYDQLVMMGEYFREQLIYTKHRGAFEQSYVGFCDLCHCLWRSSLKPLHDLPSLWLNELLQDVLQNASNVDHLCATRRSAGLPFMVLAVIVTEIGVGRSRCFDQAMNNLLDVASKDESDDIDQFKVHSLNILRAIYRETRLGEAVMPYAARGVEASFLGFQSKSWAVRNSATLLFSALMTRIFGVNRSKDEVDRKNCLTARVFFSRFPSLFETILNFLKTIPSQAYSAQENFNPVIYPILLLLGRLNPSATDGSDSNLRLAEFVPFVQRCAYNAILKTRVLAARAVVPLISTASFVSTLQELFDCIPEQGNHIRQNHLHGVLLQIKCMLEGASKLPIEILDEIKTRLGDFLQRKVMLVTKSNPCYYTRATFCEIIIVCIKQGLLLQDHPVLKQLLQEFLEDSSICKSNRNIPSPGIELLSSTSVPLIMLLASNHGRDIIIKSICHLLQSDLYETRLSMLQLIKTVISSKQSEIMLSSIESLVFPVTTFSSYEKDFKETIMRSDQIAKQLVTLLSNPSEQTNCVVESSAIMKHFPRAIELPWFDNEVPLYTVNEKLKFLLHKLQQSLREDLFCSYLQLSGILVKQLPLQKLEDDVKAMLTCWTNIVLKASNSNQSTCLRVSTISVIRDNFRFMLCTQAAELVTTLWTVCLILLQDDESVIREEAAKVVDCLVAECNTGNIADTKLPLQATVASDRLVQLFVKSFSKQPDICISTLILWILGIRQFECSNTTEFSEDSPFDKGEMNMYFETVIVTRLIKKYLQNVLADLPEDQSNLILHFPAVSRESPKLVDIRTFLVDQLTDLKSFAEDYHKKVNQSIFICRNVDDFTAELFQKLVLIQSIYKHVDSFDSNYIASLKLPVLKFFNPLDSEIFSIVNEIKNHVSK